MRGLPSQVKGAALRRLSRRGSWVRIPPPAPLVLEKKLETGFSVCVWFLLEFVYGLCMDLCMLSEGFFRCNTMNSYLSWNVQHRNSDKIFL